MAENGNFRIYIKKKSRVKQYFARMRMRICNVCETPYCLSKTPRRTALATPAA